MGAALPVDPVNKHAACTATGYDSTTCWNGASGQYICPAGSHVYSYANLTQDSYKFGSDFEYNSGIGWASNSINANFSIAGNCSAGAVFGTSAKCGDGIVGANEDCEKGDARLNSCSMPDGKTGNQKLTCGTNCKWDTSAPCQAGQCGDGIKQSNEICDDGQNNGKYGYCKTDCIGTGSHCGDLIVNGSEQCDLGRDNGVYGLRCSWDCKKPGPVCGDNIIQEGDEKCDGNTETKKTDVSGVACPNTIINGVSYPQQNTRNCHAADGSLGQCKWDNWSGCQPAGICGNGAKEGTEQCDTVSGTSGACVMNCSTSGSCDLSKTPAPYACKTAVCGDGYLWTNHEACDVGVNNGKECVAGYGLTCNYCGNACTIITKTGGYCGDKIKNGPEDCDDKDFGTNGCATFGGSSGSLQCLSDCKIKTGLCVYTIVLPPPSGPVCGDGICQGDENCGGCPSDCKCSSGQTCFSGQCLDPYVPPPPPPPPPGPTVVECSRPAPCDDRNDCTVETCFSDMTCINGQAAEGITCNMPSGNGIGTCELGICS